MYKKLSMACMALVAVVVSIAAPMASASPVFTDNGQTLPLWVSIQARSTGLFNFTGSFNVQCSTAVLNGVLAANSGTQIKSEVPVGGASFSGTGTSGDCTSFFGSTKLNLNSKLCMETVKGTDNMIFTGCGGNVGLTLEVTGIGPCKYETASLAGTFLTNTDARVSISEQSVKLKEGSWACPGEGKVDVVWDWYTTSIWNIQIT